ncbi:MAG: type I restriction enzyme HsdR N-terminal domain-containing protein [Prevotella sp.]|nr:type I restriction enzyme HsdR N-terminal domain-containing protein [Prevotella sp.]
MVDLTLPSFGIRIMEHGGKRVVFDPLRRRYVSLTPEEWVRQHFVNYLTAHLGYPMALLANEVELQVGQKRLRCDTVVYGKQAEPLMIVEYKAPHIPVTQKVFDQVSAYNLLLHVDYLLVSNGVEHYCCKMDYDNQKYLFLESIPTYENILQK